MKLLARVPIEIDAATAILKKPFSLPSESLLSWLDDALAELRRPKSDRSDFFPDSAWLTEHLQFLTRYSGFEVLALAAMDNSVESLVGWEGDEDLGTEPAGYLRQVEGVRHLAFAYAEASLVESMASQLPADFYALLSIVNDQRCGLDVLFGMDQGRSVLYRVPDRYDTARNSLSSAWHPWRRWLSRDVDRSAVGATVDDWPAWVAVKDRVQSPGSAVALEWKDFLYEQTQRTRCQATPQHPVRLGRYHFSDGRRVFYDGFSADEPVELEGCDPLTFAERTGSLSLSDFGTDASGLWLKGERLPCAHPESFARLPQGGSFQSDGRYVYNEDGVIAEVDASKVLSIPGDGYKDGFLFENTLYMGCGLRAWEVDAASFRALGASHYVDRDHVYEWDGKLRVVEGFDPATARLVEHGGLRYLFDAKQVRVAETNRSRARILKGANAAQFRGVEGLSFVTDGKRVWLHAALQPDLDGSQLRLPLLPKPLAEDETVAYFLHGGSVYFHASERHVLLDQADAASFEILHYTLARDKDHVWYDGKLVEGARAEGFAWLRSGRGRWTDGVAAFKGDKRVDDRALQSERVSLRFDSKCVEVIGDRLHWEDLPVEGWAPDRIRIGSIGFLEDDQFLYAALEWGRGIAVWPKSYSEIPLTHFEKRDGQWVLASPAPEVNRAAFQNWGDIVESVIPLEEFRLTFESFPPKKSHVVTWTYTAPDARIALTVGDYGEQSLSVLMPVRFRAGPDFVGPNRMREWIDGPDTLVSRLQIRQLLDRFVGEATPLSFTGLKELVQRIPAQSKSLMHKDEAQGFAMLVQEDCVWLDLKITEGHMLRMFAGISDGGLFDSYVKTGPLHLWGAVNDDDPAFEDIPWTDETRRAWRQAIASVLAQYPVQRKKAPDWWPQGDIEREGRPLSRPELKRLFRWMAPSLTPKELEPLLKSVLEPPPADSEDLSFDAGPAQTQWEAFLETLQDLGVLQVLEKEGPEEAVEQCQQLARSAGIDETFTLSDDEADYSYFDVATDFEQWLKPRGYLLISPFGMPLWETDEHFPAVVVSEESWPKIEAACAKLGEGRGFSE